MKAKKVNESIGDVFPPMSKEDVITAYKSRPEYERFLKFLGWADLLDSYDNLSLTNENEWGGNRQIQYTFPAEILDIILKQRKGKEHWFVVYLKNFTGKYTKYYSDPIFEERIMASPKRLKDLVFVWIDVDEQLQELKEFDEFNKKELGNIVDYIRQNNTITSAPYYRDAIDKKILIDNLIKGSKIKYKN